MKNRERKASYQHWKMLTLSQARIITLGSEPAYAYIQSQSLFTLKVQGSTAWGVWLVRHQAQASGTPRPRCLLYQLSFYAHHVYAFAKLSPHLPRLPRPPSRRGPHWGGDPRPHNCIDKEERIRLTRRGYSTKTDFPRRVRLAFKQMPH